MAAAPEREEEPAPRPAVDLTVSCFQTTISIKIADRQLAGYALAGIGIGCGVALATLFYKQPELVTGAVTRALEGPGLRVGNIAPGSILVELNCDREKSFLSFMEDFETGKVNQRVNKEFKEIGCKEEFEVTIINDKEVYEKLDQIRVWTHSFPAEEGGKLGQAKLVLDTSNITESNSFEIQTEVMKLLKRVHKRDLQEIEENFGVKIVWDGNTNKVLISTRKIPNRLNRLDEGCDAFVDLYQKFHRNVGREKVELPNSTDEIRIMEVVSLAEAENPVIFEKVDNDLMVYAEKNKISSLVLSFKEKLGLTHDGSKTKRVQGNKRHDAREENEAPQKVFQQRSTVRSTANESTHPNINRKTNATYVDRKVSSTSPVIQSFEIEPKIVAVCGKAHDKELGDIETKYHVVIPRKVTGNTLCLKPNDECSADDYEEACNQFIDLYQIVYQLIKMERFSLKDDRKLVTSRSTISKMSKKIPILVDLCADRVHWEIYGEANHIEEALKYLKQEGVKINREKENAVDDKGRHKQGAMDVFPPEHSRGDRNLGNRLETFPVSNVPTKVSSTERMAGLMVVPVEDDIKDIDLTSVRRSVCVTGFQAGTKPEDLIIHFTHMKNGGGDIERIIVSKKEAAVITFDYPEVVERVLEHSHIFDGSQLMVQRIIPKKSLQLSYQSRQQDLQAKENIIREQQRRLEEEHQQKTALEERLRSLEQRMEKERNSHLSTERELQSAVSAENQQKTALEQRLISLEQRMKEDRNSHLSTVRELRSAVSAADYRLQEENQQKTALEQSLRSLEQRIEEQRKSHLSTERELRSAVSTAEDALAEYQRQKSRDWIIQREEVVLNEKILGRGAWGSVREGTFRGCQVAVKEIHELILSDYNRGLFEREMSIASRCRHPNLLQFIGATNDEESPLFVTELLDTSLRNVLHQRALNHGEIVTLTLDVAKGLNYLHLSTPLPIMHRDISSANVLLWRRDESWRAKLSDYGAANFLRQSMTVNAGAIIYSAPEAFTPRQSTKVDVYSFGVLLCEMCIRQLPDPQQLRNQIGRVNQSTVRGLIQRCVQRDPETRPTMGEVIHELEQLVLESTVCFGGTIQNSSP